MAFGEGAERTAGMACDGTCAADMCGPRGALDGPIGAERTCGAEAERCVGCAGAWYGVGYTRVCAATSRTT